MKCQLRSNYLSALPVVRGDTLQVEQTFYVHDDKVIRICGLSLIHDSEEGDQEVMQALLTDTHIKDLIAMLTEYLNAG